MAVKSRRSKVKGRRLKITHTVITPKWMRDLRAAWKGLRRNAWNLLAGIGLLWVVWQVMLILAAKAGGG